MFLPVIKILEVSRDSKWLTLKDNTQPYDSVANPTGFGVPGGPANLAAITSVQMQMQYFGTEPSLLPLSTLSGDLSSSLLANYGLKDGVYIVHVLYGMVSGVTFTLAGNVITTTDTGDTFTNKWSGVGYVCDQSNPQVLYRIQSTNATAGTIILYTAPLVPIASDGLMKIYDGITRILILNCGEKKVITDISRVALETGCDAAATQNLIDRLILKMQAQVAFNCGDYSRAHNAGVLYCDSNSIIQPCQNCGQSQ
jgi:hypothetical protein